MERVLHLQKVVAQVRREALTLVAAIALAFGVVYVVGFAPYPAVHDAFHDVRHGSGFPCH